MGAKDVHYLPWSAKMLDSNIIENVWGAKARDKYVHEGQFPNVNDSTEVIQVAWFSIGSMYIKTVYQFFTCWIISVIKKKFASIDY